MSKVKEYNRIQRGKEETIGKYIQRYERIPRICKNAGGEAFGNGMKGWHLLGQTGLSVREERLF